MISCDNAMKVFGTYLYKLIILCTVVWYPNSSGLKKGVGVCSMHALMLTSLSLCVVVGGHAGG